MHIPPFTAERFFARFETGIQHHLSTTGYEPLTLEELLALEPEAAKSFRRLSLGYPETRGSLALREAIAGLYETLTPDDILVHAGSAEGIFNALNALLAPGDSVMVQTPCYQSLKAIPQAIGCHVAPWEMSSEPTWMMKPEDWPPQAPSPKALILNWPHNPTGYTPNDETWQRIRDVAMAQNIVVFCDEVYREFGPHNPLPAACDWNEQAVSVGGLSKTFGLPGLRLGWVATRNRALLQKIASLKDYTTICHSTISEFLALLAIRHRDALMQRNRQIAATHLPLLQAFMEQHRSRLAWHPPQVGAVAFPWFTDGTSAEAFCLDLAERRGILLLPGKYYDWPDRYFRLGFGRRDFPTSLAALAACF